MAEYHGEQIFREGPGGDHYRQIVSADDVDELVIKAAEDTLEWFADVERIDWEDFFDRMDHYIPDDYEFPELDSAAARKIKKHIREIRANS